MKKLIFIIATILIVAAGCGDRIPDGYKLIKTEGFSIQVPSEWKYEKEQGIDSFIGSITGNGINLSFDMSDNGAANHLIPTEMEFIHENRDWVPVGSHPYMKVGITYTTGDVEEVRNKILDSRSINDTSVLKVEKIYYPDEEILFQNGNYKAILTYKDTLLEIDIKIPEEVRQHNFQLDTLDNLFRKIVTPKKNEEGMTGVYYGNLDSPFNFNLVGRDLNQENQKEAEKAFKTIKFLKWADETI